jgi:cytoskeletal protein RodZ
MAGSGIYSLRLPPSFRPNHWVRIVIYVAAGIAYLDSILFATYYTNITPRQLDIPSSTTNATTTTTLNERRTSNNGEQEEETTAKIPANNTILKSTLQRKATMPINVKKPPQRTATAKNQQVQQQQQMVDVTPSPDQAVGILSRKPARFFADLRTEIDTGDATLRCQRYGTTPLVLTTTTTT